MKETALHGRRLNSFFMSKNSFFGFPKKILMLTLDILPQISSLKIKCSEIQYHSLEGLSYNL